MIHYGKKLDQIPSELCSVADYEARAKAQVAPDIWEYIDSGAGDEVSKNNNSIEFKTVRVWNRVLRDVSAGNTHCVALNQALNHPIIYGPVAHQKLLDPAGELATVQAAEATDTLMVVSSLASQTLEDIAQNTSGALWFQLYWQSTREQSLALVRRAENAGYSALVVTVDVPINGLRRRIQRAGFTIPPEAAAVNASDNSPSLKIREHDSEVFQGWMSFAPTWNDIAWLAGQTRLPVLLKGILHPEDARQAREVGAQGIVISNHGGRALDGVPTPLSVLPKIRSTLGDSFPLFIDGGVRQGSDVFKAIALGANAVMIGRPQLYGLGVAGALGVAHLTQVLRQELEVTMALAGCASIADINSHCLA